MGRWRRRLVQYGGGGDGDGDEVRLVVIRWWRGRRRWRLVVIWWRWRLIGWRWWRLINILSGGGDGDGGGGTYTHTVVVETPMEGVETYTHMVEVGMGEGGGGGDYGHMVVGETAREEVEICTHKVVVEKEKEVRLVLGLAAGGGGEEYT
ncbi:hypothetical protein HAX54_038171 [Datura stramonium]|uniref:Uncharacterized protein n=1 Tax=Datura stramonium TaxID=4076 RepID=A0ABS8RMR4_DATST|nr:hypothetical protein [Datura stramonium]